MSKQGMSVKLTVIQFAGKLRTFMICLHSSFTATFCMV